MIFKLTCSCGWTHEATTRASATQWKKWHREAYLESGNRLSETGHDVTVKKQEVQP